MSLLDEEVKKSLEILKALDQAIEAGPWDKTLFLRGIGKKLRDARERFVRDLSLENLADQALTAEADARAQANQDADYVAVYVSLYQAEGANIRKWTAILSSLSALSISRPIYKNEEDIQTAIRTKAYKVNDAYVVVKVRKEHVLEPPKDEKPPVDRYGRELLIVREGAVRIENIVRFVHTSGEYQFRNGMLVK